MSQQCLNSVFATYPCTSTSTFINFVPTFDPITSISTACGSILLHIKAFLRERFI